MATYVLTERSAGELIRAVFSVYFQHFFTIFMAYAVVGLPCAILIAIAQETLGASWMGLLEALYIVSNTFAAGALTVCVGDICLGRDPSVRRAYQQVGHGLWVKMLATNVMQTVAVSISLILLVIPGFVAAVWFLPASCVVVLEGTWGRAALSRSRRLVAGSFWHIVGVWLALFCVIFVVSLMMGMVCGVGAGLTGINSKALLTSVMIVPITALQVLGVLGVVFIYYDLRVRKEAYDNQILAADLMR
ncbi:MAG TPA: hypothetical protein VKK81_11490 [Candidatus Binatia bacterium]|nr:hypothetical protein [Candidatus Binatia bacterium]